MKKAHRRAGWLVAGMLGMSLLLVPREGGARVQRWREPTPPVEGDPDTPGGLAKATWNRWSLMLNKISRSIAAPAGKVDRLRHSSDTRGGVRREGR